MRPSLTDIRQTEQYLRGKMPAQDAAVFEARLLTDPLIKANTSFLQKTFSLLRLYHRKQLKAEAAAVHHKIFIDPARSAFQRQILQLFKK